MVLLKAKTRDKVSRKNHSIRKQGFMPAVLYGAEIKNLSIEVDQKEFEDVYKEAGESSLVSLEIEGKTFSVLIHQIARDPITGKFLHVDFYHPSSKKKVEAEIPLIFEGEAPAVKELGGTLEKGIQVVEVKGLAQDLPREIRVNVENLKTFEDRVLIKDLEIPERVEILKGPDEIVVHVTPPGKVEEELAAEQKKAEEEKAGEEKPEEEKDKEKAEEDKDKDKEKAGGEKGEQKKEEVKHK